MKILEWDYDLYNVQGLHLTFTKFNYSPMRLTDTIRKDFIFPVL